MKSLRQKKRLVVVILGILLSLVLLGIIRYKLLLHDLGVVGSASNQTKISNETVYISADEINDAQELNGVPFDRGSIPGSGLDFYWVNATVVDGNYECKLYDRQTFQVFGFIDTTAGASSPPSSDKTYYQNNSYDINFIENAINFYCKKSD